VLSHDGPYFDNRVTTKECRYLAFGDLRDRLTGAGKSWLEEAKRLRQLGILVNVPEQSLARVRVVGFYEEPDKT
jgi:hypothetical protein